MTLWKGITGLNFINSLLGDLDAVAISYRIAQLAKEILPAASLGEPSAISLDEQMAALAKKTDIRQVLLEIAEEEKTHVGNWPPQVPMQPKETPQDLTASMTMKDEDI